MKGTIGNPKYKIGDEVEFLKMVEGIQFRLKGEILFRNPFGATVGKKEPSYDILVKQFPLDWKETLVRGVSESEIYTGDPDIVDPLPAVTTGAGGFMRHNFDVRVETALRIEKIIDGKPTVVYVPEDRIDSVFEDMVSMWEQQGLIKEAAYRHACEDATKLAWEKVVILDGGMMF